MGSEQGGLGLDAAKDNNSKDAMQISLPQLLDEDVALLQGRRLDKDYFNNLLSGDPIRDFLQWLEFGDIDHEGHERGWKISKQIDGILLEIVDRVQQLLSAGWQTIRIVTDHGWLLLPGGLPKIELPKSLAENKWGRCAALKVGAVSDERVFPWYWNHEQHFALATGISCYKRGEEYAHGGLSLQECLTLELRVVQDMTSTINALIEITDVVWKGLRCKD